MKKIVSIVSLSMLALTTAYAQSDDVYYSNDQTYASNNYDNSYDNNYDNSYQDYSNSYQTFYDAMSPYGNWVNNPQYGYVWMPTTVAADFSPYMTGGHWAYTDYGWTWVSDYDWGWAAFHYGRWFHDDEYGWMWAPGSEWAPAWVMWGSYSNNYCWAPIAPGYGFSSYYRPEARYWNFVGCENITDPYLGNHIVNHNVFVNNTTVNITNNITIINNSGSYNNSHFFAGPRVNEVEKATGHRIQAISITASSRPSATHVNGNQMQIYRPAITKAAVNQNHNTMQHQNGMNINRTDVNHSNGIQRNNFSSENTNSMQRAQQQRAVDQNQMMQRNTQRTFSQPERQQISQPVRQNAQPQRAYTQPERQQYSQPVQRPQDRSFASAQRSAPQQFYHQSAPVSRASFSPQASRGGRSR